MILLIIDDLCAEDDGDREKIKAWYQATFKERKTMVSLIQLQEEVGKWSEANFGDQPAVFPLLGVGEEVGELMHAHLKGLQGIRHTLQECRAMKIDAVGDIIIYLADYCHREGLSLDSCVSEVWNTVVSRRNWTEDPKDAGQSGAV